MVIAVSSTATCAAAGMRPSRGRRRRRVWWTLVLSSFLLMAGFFAANASARPAPGQPAPPPVPIPTGDACTPDTPVAVCQLPGGAAAKPVPSPASPTPAPPAPRPCTGEDCIPQPTTAPPPEAAPQPGDGAGDSDSDCGVTDVGACIGDAINSVFSSIVDSALTPILDMIGHSALSTPTISDLPGIGEMWNHSWGLVVASYGLIILVGGIVVMSHESIQARYSIKEVGPRIPVAFVASALSLFFVDKFIQLANAMSLALLDGGVAPPNLAATVQDAIHQLQSGGLFFILVALALVVAGLALLLVYVVRVVITLLLIVSGPLFLMCHALPHTDGIARWWWKATAATLAIQVAQALVLITAVRTVLTGGSQLLSSTALPALGTTLAAVALFFVLFKIPFWLLNAANVGTGRSFLGGLVRTVIAAKAFGLAAKKTGTNSSRMANHATGNRRVAPGTQPGSPSSRGQRSATPEMVNKRLKAAYDAERAQAARRPRVPSQAPRFLQPSPQQSVHDPAVTPPVAGRTVPGFSSASAPDTPMSRPRRGPRPGTAPKFREPGGPARRRRTRAANRPVRVAAVPPQLRFQSAAPPSPPTRPAKSSAAPAAPVFRPAQPEPRLGDAARRTHAAPPAVFRPPAPPRGGDRK